MNRRTKLLVVDDEDIVRESLHDWLCSVGYDVLTAASAEQALRIITAKKVKIMIADLIMPGMNGIDLMRQARTIVPTISTIIITAHGTVQSAIAAMREGAYDYVEKPFCPEKIELLIRNLVEHHNLVEENISLRQKIADRYGIAGIIAKSPGMTRVLELVKTVAPTSATVLITGESGTGKEVVARAIHGQSRRRDKAFVVTSCAALPETLLESELFGYEKGAFTGAVERRKGKFEAADKGTLFLDEIGEIDANAQVHLLRALEEKKVTRVGGNEETAVDVRIIAATNQSLRAMVDAGQFREDLYYRLNVVTVDLPPLRSRREDILPLAEHFLEKYARENRKGVSGFAPEVIEFMLDYRWRGNVRELENMVERGVILAQGNVITLAELPPEVARPVPADDYTLEAMERNHILKVVDETGGNIARSAKMLGIHRMTLYSKLKKHGISANRLDR